MLKLFASVEVAHLSDDAAATPLVERHTPLIAKQPDERSIPTPVEVAVVLKRVSVRPPVNVEVAVEVAVKYGAAICLHASSPPANVEVPTPFTAIFCVVVGARDDWPKTFVVTDQSRTKLSDEVEIFELNEVQSAAERQPNVAPFAVVQLNDVPSYESPVPAVVVAAW
jgi:hypothetical protein